MDDQRKFRRFDACFAVLLNGAGALSRRVEAKMVDLSCSGIGVTVREQLTLGEKLTVEVQDTTLPSNPGVIAEGEVVYMECVDPSSIHPRKAGIRFTRPDTTAVQQLLQLIQSRQLVESRRRQRASKQRRTKAAGWF
jgi:hypothetical protein